MNPASRGMNPASRGMNPAGRGTNPTRRGTNPTSRGTKPTGRGTNSPSRGTNPTEGGTKLRPSPLLSPWKGEADSFGLGKLFGRVDVPKRQSQSIVTFDLIRRKNPHLHLWEPGDDFPLVCVNCRFYGRKAGLAAVDGVKWLVAFI